MLGSELKLQTNKDWIYFEHWRMVLPPFIFFKNVQHIWFKMFPPKEMKNFKHEIAFKKVCLK